jgi:hypothetical protein
LEGKEAHFVDCWKPSSALLSDDRPSEEQRCRGRKGRRKREVLEFIRRGDAPVLKWRPRVAVAALVMPHQYVLRARHGAFGKLKKVEKKAFHEKKATNKFHKQKTV